MMYLAETKTENNTWAGLWAGVAKLSHDDIFGRKKRQKKTGWGCYNVGLTTCTVLLCFAHCNMCVLSDNTMSIE